MCSHLNENKLSGEVPRQLANLKEVQTLCVRKFHIQSSNLLDLMCVLVLQLSQWQLANRKPQKHDLACWDLGIRMGSESITFRLKLFDWIPHGPGREQHLLHPPT